MSDQLSIGTVQSFPELEATRRSHDLFDAIGNRTG